MITRLITTLALALTFVATPSYAITKKSKAAAVDTSKKSTTQPVIPTKKGAVVPLATDTTKRVAADTTRSLNSFQDANKNGIDDRLEKNTATKKAPPQSATTKKTPSPPSTKTKSSATKKSK